MSKLLVCSESTKDFLSDFDEVRVVKGAPDVSILSEVGSYEKVTAIGGGAVVDTAKILSSKPIVCYPTTASGATETSWSVYWDGTDKKSLKRQKPKEVIIKTVCFRKTKQWLVKNIALKDLIFLEKRVVW